MWPMFVSPINISLPLFTFTHLPCIFIIPQLPQYFVVSLSNASLYITPFLSFLSSFAIWFVFPHLLSFFSIWLVWVLFSFFFLDPFFLCFDFLSIVFFFFFKIWLILLLLFRLFLISKNFWNLCSGFQFVCPHFDSLMFFFCSSLHVRFAHVFKFFGIYVLGLDLYVHIFIPSCFDLLAC